MPRKTKRDEYWQQPGEEGMKKDSRRSFRSADSADKRRFASSEVKHKLQKDLFELVNEVRMLTSGFLQQENVRAGSRETKHNLDLRALPCEFWWTDDWLALKKRDSAMLEHYGGFEQVNSDCTIVVSDIKFYQSECECVRNLIASLQGNN